MASIFVFFLLFLPANKSDKCLDEIPTLLAGALLTCHIELEKNLSFLKPASALRSFDITSNHDCLHKKWIWQNFLQIRLSQGDRAYLNVFFEQQLLKIKFNENAMHTPVNHVSTMLCRKRSYILTYHKKKFKLKTVIDIVKMVTTEGLKCLCDFFGSLLGVGVRKKFPAIKQP